MKVRPAFLNQTIVITFTLTDVQNVQRSSLSASQRERPQEGMKVRPAFLNQTTVITFTLSDVQSVQLSSLSAFQRGAAAGYDTEVGYADHARFTILSLTFSFLSLRIYIYIQICTRSMFRVIEQLIGFANPHGRPPCHTLLRPLSGMLKVSESIVNSACSAKLWNICVLPYEMHQKL